MILPTSGVMYRLALQGARLASPLIASSTSSPDEIGAASFFLSDDTLSGYGIDADATLVGLYSLMRGRGDALVRDAVGRGARHLDCFDGYLPRLYMRHGFTEIRREPNWTPGGPDVVYMSLTH